MTQVDVVRVFVGSDGAAGNPLGVVLDGAEVPPERRQGIAAELGFSETVFVDDRGSGRLEIYTPVEQLPFAGHPLVGCAWLLGQRGTPVDALRPPAGVVPTWQQGDLTWIRGRPEWAPRMTLRRLETAAEVEALPGPPADGGFVYCWAWIDEHAGLVRSRSFPMDVGIAEDEATGAAAVRLVGVLARPLVIHQGVGSQLHARPGPDGSAEVGGRVAYVAAREVA